MKKSLLSLLLVIVMLFNVLVLAGCEFDFSLDVDDKEEVGKVVQNFDFTGVDMTKDITITFASTQGAALKAITDRYIAKFMELYPNITVEHTTMGDYDDARNTVTTQLAAGQQPNIAYCYPDHVAGYNLANAVVSLNSLISSTVELERADGTTEIIGLTADQIADFVPAYYAEGAQFGHVTPEGEDVMYTMPFFKSTELLYYNATYFEEHGLTVPQTWDQMEAVCARILEIEAEEGRAGKCIPLGYDSEANWFITMCEQYGSGYTSAVGEHYLFDNETNFNFVKRIRDWHQKGYVTTEELYGAYTSGLFTGADEDGQVAYMCIGSSAGAQYQKAPVVNGEPEFEVGIASIPQVDPNHAKVISQGPSVCILQGKNITKEEIVASWLLVKYLTTNVLYQAEYGLQSGYVPVIKSVMNNPTYAARMEMADGYNNLTALAAKKALEQAESYYASPAFNGSSAAREQVGYLLTTVMAIKDSDGDVDALIRAEFKKAIEKCKAAK